MRTLGVSVDHKCCWHRANIQHAVTNHRDEVCCHCGVPRCVELRMRIPEGHGPFCPEKVSRKEEEGNDCTEV
jgi:hypothetical protein